jgi:hypothetical protein
VIQTRPDAAVEAADMTEQTADVDTLLAPRLPEEDVPLAGLGRSVRIRSLSRLEVLRLKNQAMPVEVAERKLLALSLVAPVLTEDQVLAWQEASTAGELEPVTNAIMRLSGLESDAPKAAVKRFRG